MAFKTELINSIQDYMWLIYKARLHLQATVYGGETMYTILHVSLCDVCVGENNTAWRWESKLAWSTMDTFEKNKTEDDKGGHLKLPGSHGISTLYVNNEQEKFMIKEHHYLAMPYL